MKKCVGVFIEIMLSMQRKSLLVMQLCQAQILFATATTDLLCQLLKALKYTLVCHKKYEHSHYYENKLKQRIED